MPRATKGAPRVTTLSRRGWSRHSGIPGPCIPVMRPGTRAFCRIPMGPLMISPKEFRTPHLILPENKSYFLPAVFLFYFIKSSLHGIADQGTRNSKQGHIVPIPGTLYPSQEHRVHPRNTMSILGTLYPSQEHCPHPRNIVHIIGTPCPSLYPL